MKINRDACEADEKKTGDLPEFIVGSLTWKSLLAS